LAYEVHREWQVSALAASNTHLIKGFLKGRDQISYAAEARVEGDHS